MNSQTEMKEMLEIFEARRRACVRRLWISLVLIGVVLAGSFYALYSSDVEAAGAYAVPPFLAIFAVALCYFFITGVFKSDYKSEIVKRLLESYGEGLSYDPGGTVEQRDYESSGLFHKKVERYRGEDYLTGTHRGASFRLSELHTEYKTVKTGTSSGSNDNYHTIFKGIFCVVELPQGLDLSEPVLVLPTTLENMVESWGLRLEKSRYRRTELLDTRDPRFEEEFYVYGPDPAQAQWLLTPELRACILHYQQQVDNQLHLSFTDEAVYIAISSFKNYFEPRLFAPLTDPETLKVFTDDLDLIMEIIDSVTADHLPVQ